MRDRSDRYQIQSRLTALAAKRIGAYLMEAGLLTKDQITVALNDQQATGMRFGEVVVARGWVKEQTVEWIVKKVIEPERRFVKRQEQLAAQAESAPVKPVPTSGASSSTASPKPFVRREAPISKPLPSVNSSDPDVNWVG